MQLLVIRHAIAQTREEFAITGEDDALRPLTEEGRRQMARAAKGLQHIVSELDVLGSSPYLRAMQTAAVVAEEYGGTEITTVKALQPDSTPEAVVAWLRRQRDAEMVAIVGHEPHLGMLVTWLLTGLGKPRVSLRKGGACMLDFAAQPRKGGATLRWALTPALLRRIRG